MNLGRHLANLLAPKTPKMGRRGCLWSRLRANGSQYYPKTPQCSPKAPPCTTQRPPKTPKMSPFGPPRASQRLIEDRRFRDGSWSPKNHIREIKSIFKIIKLSRKSGVATLLNYTFWPAYLRTLAACLWPLAPRRDARSA